MLLIEKSRAALKPEELRLAGLLDALLDGKISMDIYLGFAGPGRSPIRLC